MMYRLVLLFALATFSSGQFNRDPKTAAILNEARYLSVDGKFGAAYKQEDGVEFKEESDVDGTRRGTYSYVDPTGQRRTISYVAGKNGFEATGDHLPVGPAPVPSYTPLPQYNPPPQQSYDNNQQNWDDGNDGRWEQPQPQSRPQPQWNPPQQQQWNPPQPAYNAPPPPPARPQPQPQWNPPPQQQQQQQQQQQWNNYDSAPAPQPQWNPPNTTPAPHRFYPPGKLNLNRSPDGFSFTFNKS